MRARSSRTGSSPERSGEEPSDPAGSVTGVLTRPDDPWCLYVFAPGAGAGMRHDFMEATAMSLAERGVATFRFDFPYMVEGRRWPPDPTPILTEAVKAAVREARAREPGLPLFAGGKSMGGRMTSTAASEGELDGVRGIAFFGFPLHPAGRPSTKRATHLSDVGLPMLFVQGSRDALADLELLRAALRGVEPRPTVHVLEGADHGFRVLARSGRVGTDVIEELCDRFAAWARPLAGS